MRCKAWFGLLWLLMVAPLAALEPRQIAVIYNTADPESKVLAEFYAEARSIPKDHLIGLEMPLQAEISRQQYQESIVAPLRKVFEDRGWWQRRRDANGITGPIRNEIRVLLTMRGVPLKIRQSPRADGKPHPDRKKQPFTGHDEAAVDSELALLGVEGYPLDGAQRNPYHGSEQTIVEAGLQTHMLTCRIDAPSTATCKRMIEDAIAIEKRGLWGFHQIDISKKHPQGDDWLENIIKENLKLGLPTAVDRFKATLPSHYPMRDVACYYGWYDWNLSGPMLNPRFRFRKGAVAIHIHSYSAQQLRDPNKNWSGGLLEAGAAVTVGNVYEPYLGLSHHLDVLHQRLLDGHTWVEASWMAMPAVSWQGITLGDPLYRPFIHLEGKGEVLDADREYRALVAAMKRWGDDPDERIKQLQQAAERMKSGILLEALALEYLETDAREDAPVILYQARGRYTEKPDKLRQDLHLIAQLRVDGHKELAMQRLRDIAKNYKGLVEAAAIQAWLGQLDPSRSR